MKIIKETLKDSLTFGVILQNSHCTLLFIFDNIRTSIDNDLYEQMKVNLIYIVRNICKLIN